VRFKLSKLFLVVSMVALACAGMTLRTRWWAESILALTVLLFVVIAIRTIGQRGRDRAFAVSFSAVGLGYLLLLSSAFGDSVITNIPLGLSAKALGIPLDYVTAVINPPPTIIAAKTGLPPVASGDLIPSEIELGSFDEYLFWGSRPDSRHPVHAFFLIGHCVWSWLFALLAGWFAGNIYAKREGFQRTSP
jgi:hypothetical protein